MAPQATSGMPAPQFRWSPTAEDFTRHQLSHVTNFWRQGRSAEFRLKALPSGQAELCLTFELPSPCESIPPPISPAQFPPTRTPQGSGSGPKPKPAAPKVSSRQRKSYRRAVLHKASLAASSLPPPKSGSLRQAASASVQRLQADQANGERKRPLPDSPSVKSPLAQRIREDFHIAENEADSPERESLRSQSSPEMTSFPISPPGVKGFPPPAPLLFTPTKEQDGTESPIIVEESAVKEIAKVDDVLQDDGSNKTVEEKESVVEKVTSEKRLSLEERLRLEERIRLLQEALRLHKLEKEKDKTPTCRNCGEVFAVDHQCSVEICTVQRTCSTSNRQQS